MLIAAIRTALEGWDVVVALLVCLVVVLISAIIGRRGNPPAGPVIWWWDVPLVILFAVIMFGLALTVRW